MFPTSVLNAMAPVLLAMPLTKHIEDACKEASKEIQKKAKSLPAKKITEKLIEGIVCKQAGKLDQTVTKATTGVLKKQLDKTRKDVEKEIEKKGASTSQGVALTGLRDDLDAAKKQREAMEKGKPIKLPKPKGGGMHVPIKFKVLSKDKIELDVELFFGVDLKEVPKGRLPITYGVIGLGGRF